jgi:hypothetical protein
MGRKQRWSVDTSGRIRRRRVCEPDERPSGQREVDQRPADRAWAMGTVGRVPPLLLLGPTGQPTEQELTSLPLSATPLREEVGEDRMRACDRRSAQCEGATDPGRGRTEKVAMVATARVRVMASAGAASRAARPSVPTSDRLSCAESRPG